MLVLHTNVLQRIILTLVSIIAVSSMGQSQEIVYSSPRWYHLRIDGPPEWSEFAGQPDGPGIALKFDASRNDVAHTLRLRQQDVKQTWDVTLNEKTLGQLLIDENDMVVYFEIEAGTLVSGQNILRIEQPQKRKPVVDDIRVGEIAILHHAKEKLLNECVVQLEVVDGQTGELTPSRITIVNRQGALQTTGATSGDHLAVRPGIVYSSTGKAQFGLPAGRYTVFAGRGFEYSLAKTEMSLAAGETVQRKLEIRREVDTTGFVACDPHVHTLTHSGHGDASVEERMITLAAEGIELPIATDHNVNIDHRPFAKSQNVHRFFTPVIGNEVTTDIGHFNVFPIAKTAKPPNHRLDDWPSIFGEIFRTPGVRIAILNHGRDLHAGVRPLGPKMHNALVGESVKGWAAGMNGMEIINSAATQSDTLQLCHDWMGFLNRGRAITPVGSSDSHDVGRHFVGQGRTYIRCDDRDPGNIDVRAAVDNFIEGRVNVSYGLLVTLTVNGKYQAGDLARVYRQEVNLGLRVLGPHWVNADRIQLYANGQLIREDSITADDRDSDKPGLLWQDNWKIAIPGHDVHLVAVATGPGIDGLHWKTAKPYQPTGPTWVPQVFSCTGAIWLDVDRDGRETSAYEYAKQLFNKSEGNVETLLNSLSHYDPAVVVQAAHLFQSSGKSWLADDAQDKLREASPDTQSAVQSYLNAWRATQIAPGN